ncbi:MAG: hypothetical protein V4488_20635 [Pseudomonadota bacterium]
MNNQAKLTPLAFKPVLQGPAAALPLLVAFILTLFFTGNEIFCAWCGFGVFRVLRVLSMAWAGRQASLNSLP